MKVKWRCRLETCHYEVRGLASLLIPELKRCPKILVKIFREIETHPESERHSPSGYGEGIRKDIPYSEAAVSAAAWEPSYICSKRCGTWIRPRIEGDGVRMPGPWP